MKDYTAKIKVTKWKDLTADYKAIREIIETKIDEFSEGKNPIPLNIVGPFGSGKTELLYHAFKYAWKHEIPAFYSELEKFVKLFPTSDDITQEDMEEIISEKVKEELNSLREVCKSNKVISKEDLMFLPDVKYDEETLEDYFRSIPIMEINFENVKNALEKDKVILIIDEMESAYIKLQERVKASDRSPLRKVLRDVEKGNVPFYLIMSFGLTSAYEAIGAAQQRSQNTIQLPIPDPGNFAKEIIGSEGFSNLCWWASRGRIGWAMTIVDDMKNAGYLDKGNLERKNLEDLALGYIEGVLVLDTSRLEINKTKDRNFIKQLIFELSWIEKNKCSHQNISEFLDENGEYVLISDEFIEIDIIIDAIITDLDKIIKKTKKDLNIDIIRKYLRKIIEGITSDNKMGAGVWKRGDDIICQTFINPLLILLHDFILEFEGETLRGKPIVDFLYYYLLANNIIGGKVSYNNIINDFPETLSHFQKYISAEAKVEYIMLSPYAIEKLFPRILVKPTFKINEDLSDDPEIQREHIIGRVEADKDFLKIDYKNNINMTFFFIPDKNKLKDLLDSNFTEKNEMNLRYNNAFGIINLDNEEINERDIINLNPFTENFIKLKKINIFYMEEKSVRAFIISVWYNGLFLESNEQNNDLNKILSNFMENEGISRTIKRSIEHHKELIYNKLRNYADTTIPTYEENLKNNTIIGDMNFPKDRINSTYGDMKTEKTSELVICALSCYKNEGQTINFCFQFKEAEKITDAAGYKRFFEYTVIKGKNRKKATLSVRLNEIVGYIKSKNGFDILIKIFESLQGPSSEDVWEDLVNKVNVDEIIFHNVGKEEELFLRGLSSSAYINIRKDELNDKIEELNIKIDELIRRYQTFIKEIDEFNEKAKKNLISTRTIEQIIKDFKTVKNTFTSKSPFFIKYIGYNCIKKAIINLEKNRVKLKDNLDNWEDQFKNFTDTYVLFNEWKDQIEEIYQINPIIKENVRREKIKIIEQISLEIEEIRDSIFSQLDDSYDLDIKVPEINEDHLIEKKEEIIAFIKTLENDFKIIDQIISDFTQIMIELENIDNSLGE